jgi:hypothetical protein
MDEIEFAFKENGAIDVLNREIKEYRIRLNDLEEEKKKLDIEIPLTRDNLDILTKSLNIFQEESNETVEE